MVDLGSLSTNAGKSGRVSICPISVSTHRCFSCWQAQFANTGDLLFCGHPNHSVDRTDIYCHFSMRIFCILSSVSLPLPPLRQTRHCQKKYHILQPAGHNDRPSLRSGCLIPQSRRFMIMLVLLPPSVTDPAWGRHIPIHSQINGHLGPLVILPGSLIGFHFYCLAFVLLSVFFWFTGIFLLSGLTDSVCHGSPFHTTSN
ncbi:MAG: hypothetical protein R2875_09125 [Desulfobacterales bacterium]